MTKTQYYVAASIDGFIADPEDRLDWLLQFGFDAFQEDYDAFIAQTGAMIMGARTYEFILGEGIDNWSYDDTPCWVFTRKHLPEVPDANITFTEQDIEIVHAAAVEAARDKNVWLVGGGAVAAQFADRGLIDELILTVMPIVLGSGKRLLPLSAVTPPLERLSLKQFEMGAFEVVYRMR